MYMDNQPLQGDVLDPVIDLRILYDIFDPAQTELHELIWRKDATLADYLHGLPDTCEWMVYHNGLEIDPVANASTALEPGDRLSLVMVPLGGNGGFKSVLRIVLQAAAIATAFIPGLSWIAVAAINIGVGLVNSFLLGPRMPKLGKGDDSKSYGIDGAKNTSTENIVVPIIYGDFTVAGNFSDVYTENYGDTQYLYLRSILNDGPIEGVDNIYLNDQPISNYSNVQYHVALGDYNQQPHPWFIGSFRQINKGGLTLGTSYSTHTTTAPVNRLRLDILFPTGLVHIGSKSGDYKQKSVTFETRYRLVGATNWTSGGTFTVTENRTTPIRRSHEITNLPRGMYEVGIRRTNTPAALGDKYDIDQVVFVDVGEIETDPVALRGRAYLALKIQLTDQLNSMPNLTCRVRGSIVRTYDEMGNEVSQLKTSNCAWVALDAICGTERGAAYDKSRIDWPAWVEFAKHCTDNNLEFNAVFDDEGNLHDALVDIVRAGHANISRVGTKLSVAIDRPRNPVQAFNGSNIIKGTFQLEYLSVADRANEFEITYFDKLDKNKAKTIRYVDPRAVQHGDTPRVYNPSIRGIDNIAQAKKELWRALYANRLINRSVNFETYLDSISMNEGEVALIQTNMMDWSVGGRTEVNSTTSVVYLDQNIEYDINKNYALIVQHDALLRSTVTVQSIVGNKLLVSGDNQLHTKSVKRVLVNGQDLEVVSITQGTTYHTITTPNTITGVVPTSTAECWDTDVLEERNVIDHTLDGGKSVVTLSSALSLAPSVLSNYIFGEVQLVSRPFVLVGIAGDGIERRRLSFLEYHAGVYAAPEIDIDLPTTPLTDRTVNHVTNLAVTYDSVTNPSRPIVNVTLTWNATAVANYGGADVYVSINGANWQPASTVQNASEYMMPLAQGDVVDFKVVAFSMRGDRASLATAPTVGATTVTTTYAQLSEPITVQGSVMKFDVDAKLHFTWQDPTDTTGITGTEFNWRPLGSPDWRSTIIPFGTTSLDVPATTVGVTEWRIRSVGPNNTTSLWVTGAITVVAPQLQSSITNLKLNNGVANLTSDQFSTLDATFTWTDTQQAAPYFLDYQVQVKTPAGTVIRTEYVATPSYTYTFEKNLQDNFASLGQARRSFRFAVSQRGRQNQAGPVVEMLATNSQTALSAAPVLKPTLTGANVTLAAPNISDLAGFRIWASESTPVAIDNAHLVYDGPSAIVDINLDTDNLHYVRATAYDKFGKDSLTLSTEQQVTRISIDITADFDQYLNTSALFAQTILDFDTSLTNSTNALNVKIGGISPGSITANSSFGDYPATPGQPANWALWSGSNPSRVAGELPNSYALQDSVVAGVSQGSSQSFSQVPALGNIKANEYLVIEGSVRLDSGTLQGAGILLQYLSNTNTVLESDQIHFASDADSSGVTPANGIVGKTYRFTKIVTGANANIARVMIYRMTGWGGFGTIAAKTLTWYKCALRPASLSEVRDQTVLAPMEGAVSQHTTDIQTVNGSLAALSQRVVAGNPNLIPNSGFENGLTSWTQSAGIWDVASAGTSAVYGTHAYCASSDNGGSMPNASLVSDWITIKPGLQYTLSADWRTTLTAGEARMDVLWYQADKTTLVLNDADFAVPNGREFYPTGPGRPSNVITYMAPANAAYARVRLFNIAGTVGTQMAVRQVKFEIGPVATAYSSETSISQAFTAISSANGNISTLNTKLNSSYSSTGGNLAPNPDFAIDVSGWNSWLAPSSVATFQRDLAGSNWRPQGEHTLGMYNGTGSDAMAAQGGAKYSQWYSNPINVTPGQFIECSVYHAEHRCDTAFIVHCYNSADGFISPLPAEASVTGTSSSTRSNGGMTLASWGRFWIRGQVPANTAYVRLTFIKYGTDVNSVDSYAWMLRPQLTLSYSGAPSPAPYYNTSNTASLTTMQSAITTNATTLSNLGTSVATLESRVTAGNPNIVPNGGFEKGLQGWTQFAGAWNVDSGLGWGPHAFWVGNTTAILGVSGSWFSVAPNTQYTIAADMALFASNANAHCYVDIIYIKADGSSTATGSDTGQNAQFANFDFSTNNSRRGATAFTSTAPADAVYAFARFVVNPNGATVTYASVRQIKVERGNQWTPYTAEASAAMLAGALTTVEGKTQAYLNLTAAAGNSAAAVQIVANGQTSGIELQADAIRLGSSKLPAMDVVNGQVNLYGKLSVPDLSAITANIGVLRTAQSGARMEIRDNVIKVYDVNNVLRVQLGDLTL